MTAIAIDLGSTKVKLAIAHSAQTPTCRVQSGTDCCIVIPSCMYVSPDGEILSGDAAAEAIARDPQGAVRDVTSRFHRPESFPSNGHQVDRRLLLVRLLGDLRNRCELTTGLTGPWECCLTVPATFDAHRKECLAELAGQAGLVVIGWSENPLSVVRQWLREGGAITGPIVVACDVGGMTTELSLVRCREGQVSLDAELPPTHLQMGGCEIDGVLWELVAKASATTITTAIVPELRRQLDRTKEDLTAGRITAAALSAGEFAVAVTVEMVRKSSVQLAARLRQALDRFLLTLSSTATDPVPLVLAGGGSVLPGMVEAARLAWSRGPVHLLKAASVAAAVGAMPLMASTPTPATDAVEAAAPVKAGSPKTKNSDPFDNFD